MSVPPFLLVRAPVYPGTRRANGQDTHYWRIWSAVFALACRKHSLTAAVTGRPSRPRGSRGV